MDLSSLMGEYGMGLWQVLPEFGECAAPRRAAAGAGLGGAVGGARTEGTAFRKKGREMAIEPSSGGR